MFSKPYLRLSNTNYVERENGGIKGISFWLQNWNSLCSRCEFTPLLNWLKGQRQKAALKFTEALVVMLKQKPLTLCHKEIVANNMALQQQLLCAAFLIFNMFLSVIFSVILPI